MDESTLYWITRLDSLTNTIPFLIFMIFISGFMTTAFLTERGDKYIFISIVTHILLIICLFFAGIFIPNTQEMLVIKGVPLLIDSQKSAINKASKLPDKFITVLEQYLDDIKKDKKGNKTND